MPPMPPVPKSLSLRLAIAPLALLALSACATSAPTRGPAALASADGPSSIYGLYLAGQTALISGDSQAAADYFTRTRAASPDAGFLKERVFTAALLSGDIPLAAHMAPGAAEGSPSSQSLGILTQAVEDLANDRGREAYAKLAAPHADLRVRENHPGGEGLRRRGPAHHARGAAGGPRGDRGSSARGRGGGEGCVRARPAR